MTVEVQGVSFAYGGQEVLSGVDLTLDEDQPVLLLGASGRGKTTLLRVIAGFLQPQRGRVLGVGPETRMAVLFQEDRLFDPLTVYKNLKLVRPDLSRERAGEWLKEVGLGPQVLDEHPRALSGGMRRRIALIRALMFEAQLVLLDEPYQGLDEDTRALALAATRRHRGRRPMLVISHEAADGPALGARTVTMEEICHGQAEQTGPSGRLPDAPGGI